MSVSDASIWVCDRCKVTVSGEVKWQPTGWRRSRYLDESIQ